MGGDGQDGRPDEHQPVSVGARRRFFQHLEALTTYWHFEGWAQLMDFMMRGLEIGPYTVQKS